MSTELTTALMTAYQAITDKPRLIDFAFKITEGVTQEELYDLLLSLFPEIEKVGQLITTDNNICEHNDAYSRSCPFCSCEQLWCPDCETTPGHEPEAGCLNYNCECHL